jgi:hypothetical protein
LQTDVVPTTRYAKSGEVNIACQTFGDGPVELVFVPAFISHVELAWEEPYLARFLRRLAAFARGMENSAQPETGEFAAFLTGISDSSLTFRNLDVLREEDL